MPVLMPGQLRRLVFLGILLLVAFALIQFLPSLRSARDHAFRQAVDSPGPDIESAPPPPPSPLPPGTVLFHGALRGVEDGVPPGALEREPAYRVLVGHVGEATDEGLRGSSEGEIAYATFIKHAPELRGRVFRVAGIALDPVTPMRLAQPAPGTEDVYRVFLLDLGGEGGYVCDLVERPEPMEKGDRVEVEGVFYKLVRYDNARGKPREAPFFVARVARPLVEASSAPDSKLTALKIVIVFGIALALAVTFVLNRRVRNEKLGPARSLRRTFPPRNRPGAPGGGGSEGPPGSPPGAVPSGSP